MRKAGLDEAQAGIKIAWRNINNLRYVDDITLMAESEEELNSLSFFKKIFLFLLYFTLQYSIGFSIHWHESTMAVHAFPNMNLPPHNISLGNPRAPAPSILYPASDIDWRFISYMMKGKQESKKLA